MTKTKQESGELALALARARAKKPELDTATDTLNLVIVEVQAALAALKLGVRLSVNLLDDDEVAYSETLAFAKWDGSWQLVIETDGPNDESTVTPLVNATREDRIYAVSCFPKLVAQAVHAIEFEISRVNESTETARDVLRALKETLK